jgi:hypothetical protein
MSNPELRIEGLDKLLRKLDKMGPGVYKPALAEAGAHIKSVMAAYPPQITGRKQPPKTMRQRLFLIWAIAKGIITIPYRRGGILGKRWTVEFRDGGKTAVVGNNTKGGKFVQGAADQSRFHAAGGWKTDKQVAKEEAGNVKEILARHVREAIKT